MELGIQTHRLLSNPALAGCIEAPANLELGIGNHRLPSDPAANHVNLTNQENLRRECIEAPVDLELGTLNWADNRSSLSFCPGIVETPCMASLHHQAEF